jgi:hypothetical protein
MFMGLLGDCDCCGVTIYSVGCATMRFLVLLRCGAIKMQNTKCNARGGEETPHKAKPAAAA